MKKNHLNGIPLIECMLFTKRPLWIGLFILLTLFFGYHALHIKPEASFLRMIPSHHPYIQNYLAHQQDLKALGNVVRICVETTIDDIFTSTYLETLKNMTDEVFFISGVDRSALKSLWTPKTRWNEVSEQGFVGGPVIPATYDGSDTALEQVRQNVLKSGEVGSLVANDFKSSVIYIPLHDIDPETEEPLDYQCFSEKLEQIRSRFQNNHIKIHITGFAKVVGDLMEGATQVLLFFMIAFVILIAILLYHSCCVKSTFIHAITSMVAVGWQLGILKLCGFGLNSYSMLVPFLMFALSVSHGIQMINTMSHEIICGADKHKAAQLAFRNNVVPGLAALITDCIGFATLMIIRIGVIQDIAIAACIGVAIVAFTDLMFLPLLLSYSGISHRAIKIIKEKEASAAHQLWKILSRFIHRRWAASAIAVAVLSAIGGIYLRQDIKIGDLDPGAPEFRPQARYNKDNNYMNAHYSIGSDIFIVMLKTPPAGNSTYPVVVATDLLKWRLSQLKGVQNVTSHVDYLKRLNSAYMEGNLKWMAVPRSQTALNNMALKIPPNVANQHGKLTPMIIFLDDHKAQTLESVVDTVEAFAKKNNTDTYQFLLAAGNAGIEAATNIEVKKALSTLILLVYSILSFVCVITFKSIRAALCVVIPLMLTSVLCEALMAKANIGIKVATLPVIAVGVGIGVDYGIYILYKLLHYRTQGHPLTSAFYYTLNTTGRAVAFTGLSLAIGVGTWAFSPIKFQADMGFLLTFMFLWNMLGAMVLTPAVARFLYFKTDFRGNSAKDLLWLTIL